MEIHELLSSSSDGQALESELSWENISHLMCEKWSSELPADKRSLRTFSFFFFFSMSFIGTWVFVSKE